MCNNNKKRWLAIRELWEIFYVDAEKGMVSNSEVNESFLCDKKKNK